MIEGSRLGSRQTVQGFCVSTLPQVEQISILSSAVCTAAASGAMICSRFLIRNSAARRAERGPSPGSRARSWIRRSISGPATAVGMIVRRFPGEWSEGEARAERRPGIQLSYQVQLGFAARRASWVPARAIARQDARKRAYDLAGTRDLKQLHPRWQRQTAGDA